jgi:hypothetical protein
MNGQSSASKITKSAPGASHRGRQSRWSRMTDEERKRFYERIEESLANPPPEPTEEERDASAKRSFRSHVGLQEDGTEGSPRAAVWFFVELAPDSNQGSACRLITCKEMVEEKTYRVAVQPGSYSRAAGRTDPALITKIESD